MSPVAVPPRDSETSFERRIAVVGAGAVGCYYGGMLANAGNDVVLIGRPAHVQAVVRDGLRLEAHGQDTRIAVAASTEPSGVHDATLVLFCVKATDTEVAAASLRPHLAPSALVLTLQNGVDNADRLRARLGAGTGVEVASAVVYVATEMAGPGHVRHHGRGELVIERTARTAGAADVFAAAGVPATLSDDVRGALWAKLILNCAYNALSAIAGLPYGVLVTRPGVADVLRDVVAECLAVARADGVAVPGDIDAAVRRIAETMPDQFSSTAQDMARNKPSEIDHLNGLVLRRGEALGIPVPANRLLHTLVKLLEGRRPGRP